MPSVSPAIALIMSLPEPNASRVAVVNPTVMNFLSTVIVLPVGCPLSSVSAITSFSLPVYSPTNFNFIDEDSVSLENTDSVCSAISRASILSVRLNLSSSSEQYKNCSSRLFASSPPNFLVSFLESNSASSFSP